MSNAPFNTRKHFRVRFEGPMTFYPVLSQGSDPSLEVQAKGFEVEAQDLSVGGFSFRSEIENVTEIFKVVFQVRRGTPISTFAYLIWRQKGKFGAQFMLLDDQACEQVENYVKRALASDK